MVKDKEAFILEITTYGELLALFKQPKATILRDMNREDRTRITNGENFGFTLEVCSFS